MNYFYAQLDINDICIGVSSLNGEVPEFNYSSSKKYDPITGETIQLEPTFISRMIRISEMSDSFIGLKYNNGSWENQ